MCERLCGKRERERLVYMLINMLVNYKTATNRAQFPPKTV